MNIIFDSPFWLISALAVVIPVILLSLAIHWLVRKTISHVQLKKNHEVAAVTFSIIGILYSVILGFTVINVQDRYNKMLQTVHTEAMLLADLYRDADYFAANDRDTIRASLRSYLDYVIKEEWWQAQEKKISPKTQVYIEAIWNTYHTIDISNEKMSILYRESISKLNNFMDARLSRQFNSWEHLGSMMWTLLIVGAAITVGFMYFFGLENLRIQMVMTALLTGYLAFMLFLVFSMDNLFKGPEGIKPVDLEQVMNLFDCWDRDTRLLKNC